MVSSVKHGRPAFSLRGALMFLFGSAVLLVPGLAMQPVLLGFAALLLMAGIVTAVVAIPTMPLRDEGWLLLAEGGVMMAAGAFVLTAELSAVGRLQVIGVWALVAGVLHAFAALRLRAEAGDSGGLWLSTILSLAVGVLLITRPAAALPVAVWLLGAFAIARGAIDVHLAVRSNALRRRVAAFR